MYKKASFLTSTKIQICFTIQKLLRKYMNNKAKSNQIEPSIYNLKCGFYPKVYVSNTCTYFNKSTAKDNWCYIEGNTNSKYAEHLILENNLFSGN